MKTKLTLFLVIIAPILCSAQPEIPKPPWEEAAATKSKLFSKHYAEAKTLFQKKEFEQFCISWRVAWGEFKNTISKRRDGEKIKKEDAIAESYFFYLNLSVPLITKSYEELPDEFRKARDESVYMKLSLSNILEFYEYNFDKDVDEKFIKDLMNYHAQIGVLSYKQLRDSYNPKIKMMTEDEFLKISNRFRWKRLRMHANDITENEMKSLTKVILIIL